MEEEECQFWSSDHKGYCYLQRDYAGDRSLAQQGTGRFDELSLSNFKNGTGTGLSVDHVLGMRPLAADLQQLRLELAQPCPEPNFRPRKEDFSVGGGGVGADGDEEGQQGEGEGEGGGGGGLLPVRLWLQWAMGHEDGQVLRFPQQEVLLSTKTCANVSEFYPWYRPRLRLGPEAETAEARAAEEAAAAKAETARAGRGVNGPQAGLMWRPETDGAFVSRANLEAFSLLARPGCSAGARPWPWRSHVPPLQPWRAGPEALPAARGVALSSSDFHENLHHAVAQLLFLRRGQGLYEQLQAEPLAARLLPWEEGLESVAWDMSAHFGRRGPADLRSPLLRLLAEVLGVRGLLERERIPPPGLREPHRCYRLVMQRLFRGEVSPPRGPSSYNQLLARRCLPHPHSEPQQPGPPQPLPPDVAQAVLCRRMLFVGKPRGHPSRVLRAPRYVVAHLQRFAKSHQLTFRSNSLSTAEVAEMTVCDQLGLFLRLALHINVHGAAGIHVLWMPPGSVFVEISPQNHEWTRLPFYQTYRRVEEHPLPTRTIGQTLNTEWAIQGGRLYLNYQNVLALGHHRGIHGVPHPEELSLEPHDLVAVLEVLHEDWLQPRLPPETGPEPEECRAWDPDRLSAT